MGSREAAGVDAAPAEQEGRSFELGRALHYFLLVAGVVAVVWSIDAHFITRSEFVDLRADAAADRQLIRDDIRALRDDVRAIARHAEPAP